MKTFRLLAAFFALFLFAGSTTLAQTARVQFIHNSSFDYFASGEIEVNEIVVFNNLVYRSATPFLEIPSGNVEIEFDSENVFYEQDVVLENGGTYVFVLSGGGVEPGSFQTSTWHVYDLGREFASNTGNTDVLVHHGSIDAPTVDIYEIGVGAGEIINNLSYGDFSGYIELNTADYVIEIRDETGKNSVAAYEAPLSSLGLSNEAITVVASGFLAPDASNNDPSFGLWVALSSGGNLVQLPLYQVSQTARVQVIHNSADLAAASVDVWLNDTKLLENFAFRTASPFIDAPAGEEFTIAIQGPGSTSPENPIWSQQYTLAADETYVLVANGIVSPSGYDPVQPFDIYVYDMGREASMNAGETDVLVFHGSTDAPTVSVWEVGVGAGELFTFSYGEFAGYLELATANYSLQIRDESGQNTVATFAAPLADLGLEGQAITVFASGFLDPANNSNGENFGLFAATASGAVVPLTNTSNIENIIDVTSMAIFPNPAHNTLNVEFSIKEDDQINLEILNILGSKMMEQTVASTSRNTMVRQSFDISNLPEGIYLLSISSGNSMVTRKIQVIR
jgi:hypothetical protein